MSRNWPASPARRALRLDRTGRGGPRLRAAHGDGPALVCPGIRLPEHGKQDQVAVGTPERPGAAEPTGLCREADHPPDDPVEAAKEIQRRLG